MPPAEMSRHCTWVEIPLRGQPFANHRGNPLSVLEDAAGAGALIPRRGSTTGADGLRDRRRLGHRHRRRFPGDPRGRFPNFRLQLVQGRGCPFGHQPRLLQVLLQAELNRPIHAGQDQEAGLGRHVADDPQRPGRLTGSSSECRSRCCGPPSSRASGARHGMRRRTLVLADRSRHTPSARRCVVCARPAARAPPAATPPRRQAS